MQERWKGILGIYIEPERHLGTVDTNGSTPPLPGINQPFRFQTRYRFTDHSATHAKALRHQLFGWER